MTLIQIDTNSEQDKKVGILKAIKNLKNKEDSVLAMIDEYDIDKALRDDKDGN